MGRISITGHTNRQAVNVIIIIMKVLYCTAGGWGGAFCLIIIMKMLSQLNNTFKHSIISYVIISFALKLGP